MTDRVSANPRFLESRSRVTSRSDWHIYGHKYSYRSIHSFPTFCGYIYSLCLSNALLDTFIPQKLCDFVEHNICAI